jgi:hypothetical protein
MPISIGYQFTLPGITPRAMALGELMHHMITRHHRGQAACCCGCSAWRRKLIFFSIMRSDEAR